jgi:hypothetical protein
VGRPVNELDQREVVRTHMALADTDVVASYLGAAIARIAVDADKSPLEVVEQMLAEGTFLGAETWAPKARELKAFTRLIRQRYAGVGLYLTNRDSSQN